MQTELRSFTVAQITEGFLYNEFEGKGLYGLGGKLVIQPEYQRNYIYNDGKRDVAVIESLLQQNIRKTQALFRLVRYRQVPLAELTPFDPQLRFLHNINSPEDYQAALREVNSPATVL